MSRRSLRPRRVNLSPVAGAFAGAVTLAAGYVALRRTGVTRVDLAETLVPDRPALGRIAQLAAGTVACLPAARLATPGRGALAGLAAGCVAATTQRRSADRGLALVAHGVAGLVAGTVSRAASGRSRGG
jgi:hypothetical protein